MGIHTIGDWLQANSTLVVDLVQSVAIVGTLLIAYFQMRDTNRSNKAVVSLQVTGSHREIWSLLITNPELSRVVEELPDLANVPVSKLEEYFVIMVINHVSAAYDAHRQGMFRLYEADVQDFFTLPIPRHVWREARPYQGPELVEFIDGLLKH
jgi:hypothetical protein